MITFITFFHLLKDNRPSAYDSERIPDTRFYLDLDEKFHYS